MQNLIPRLLRKSFCTPSYTGIGKSIIFTVPRCMSSIAEPQVEPTKELKAEDKKDPLQHDDYFKVRNLVTLEGLFECDAYYGHNAGCRNEYMKPYLFGTRCDTDIFDLEQTLPLFQDALNFTAHIAYRKGIILLIDRHKQMMPFIERTARFNGDFAHCRYWQPGLFTDMQRVFGQRIRLPDLIIFFNTQNSVFKTHTGVIDAAKMLIPTIGFVDSNCDPRLISYPIPANDDSKKAILYYLRCFEKAIKAGKAKRVEHEKAAELKSKRAKKS